MMFPKKRQVLSVSDRLNVRLGSLSLKTNKTCTRFEFRMVPALLIGNFKTHRVDVEPSCPLQIVEVQFNADETRFNSAHIILSIFHLLPEHNKQMPLVTMRERSG